jgi:hypothetical protein
MSEVKRGLGRGLSALLGDVQREEPADNTSRDGGIRLIDVAAVT